MSAGGGDDVAGRTVPKARRWGEGLELRVMEGGRAGNRGELARRGWYI